MAYTPVGPISVGGVQTSSFGLIETAFSTPVIQIDFHYGINTTSGSTAIVSTGVADVSSGRLRLQTGTNAAGAATYISDHSAVYRTGQGMYALLGPVFTAGAANSTQICGIGNTLNGYFIGYNGTAFGVMIRNASVDTWTAQASWSYDKLDGTGLSGMTLDPTKLNVFKIKYGLTGGSWWVLNPTTGIFILFHVFTTLNTGTTILIANPDLQFYTQAVNTGNTTNLAVYSIGVAVFIDGAYSFIGSPRWAIDNTKAAITTETVILALKNCTTYNGFTNKSVIRFNLLSFSSTANNGIAILRMKYNATEGGVPAFTPINGTTADNGVTLTNANSTISYDVAGTTVTGGTYQYALTIASPGGTPVSVTDLDLVLDPGDTMVFSAFSSNSTSIGLAVNWFEDI